MHFPGINAPLRNCLRLSGNIVLCIAIAAGTAGARPYETGQAATIVEPKTPGIFYLLDAQNNELSLEYKVVKANSLVATVEGAQSPLRVPDPAHLRFLVRLPPGDDLAKQPLQFFQFESKNDWRSIEFVPFKPGHQLKRPPMAVVPFDLANTGTSSVILTPRATLRPGEYCLGMGGPTKDGYCFGVDEAPATASAQAGPAASSSAAAIGPPMTNADVLKMVAAGLSPDVVIGAIRQAPARSFDLSIDGLISLKKNKVPDAVVTAMQQGPAVTPTTTATSVPVPTASGSSAPPPFTGTVPLPPDESTFYYVTSAGKLGKLEKLRADQILEAQLSHSSETGWKVFGAKAGVRFPDGSVTLVVKLYGKILIFDAGKESNIRFRRWEPTTGARETWYSTRPENRYRAKTLGQGEFEFTAAKIGENTYKITPNAPLIPGEYCASTGDFHVQYCFGVDGGGR